jgi:formate dehydrogenase subunit gamma
LIFGTKQRICDCMEPAKQIDALIARHAGRDGPLLPILNDIQAAFGHVSEDAIRAVATGLNLTRAEVHGVVSFYHDYRSAPEPLPVLKLCRAEACQARGSEKLAASIIPLSKDRCAIETVYCLGLCSVGPAALVGETVHARLTHERLAALIGSIAR